MACLGQSKSAAKLESQTTEKETLGEWVGAAACLTVIDPNQHWVYAKATAKWSDICLLQVRISSSNIEAVINRFNRNWSAVSVGKT